MLGDSIRISYQPVVAHLLEGKAEVTGPAENCQYSLHTLSSLDRWLAELGRPDIVHWNNGLHDCGHNPLRDPVQFPVEVYRANLQLILQRLKTVTPHVVWATSTPVHPKRPFREDQWSWRNEEIDRYNQAASELMAENHVPVNDLHTTVAGDVNLYLSEDQLHLSPAGVEVCAQAVVKNISTFL